MENNYEVDSYIRPLQLTILDIVKDIDNLCKKHNIEYYLAYGSLIGALRHDGFIPWDDDFDIMMKWDDYLKFIDIAQKELDPHKYFVQTDKTESNYYLSFAKVRNIQTTLVEIGNEDREITYGVYVDIFPVTGYPKGKIGQLLFKINRAFTLSTNFNNIHNKFIADLFQFIIKIVGKRKIINYCEKQCTKYKCDKSDKLLSVFAGEGIHQALVDKEVFGTPKLHRFENMMLPIPQDSDKILRILYGDYMQLPNAEQIKKAMHTPYILDLNHSFDEYLKINNLTKDEFYKTTRKKDDVVSK